MSHVTSAQMRAARGLLNWSVRELSERSGVHRNTITNFETGKSGGDADTLDRLRKTIEGAGVEFTNGGQPGVRMKAGDAGAKLSTASAGEAPRTIRVAVTMRDVPSPKPIKVLVRKVGDDD